MHDEFLKMSDSILSLPPTIENEVLIRQLSHRFLSDIKLSGKEEKYKNEVRLCLRHMEKLERNLILTGKCDDFRFSFSDIGYAVGNCVIACDTLLAKSDSVLTFLSSGKVECVFSLKLITKAVISAAEIFLLQSRSSIIEFSLKKIKSATVLSAFCDCGNQDIFVFDENKDNIELLRKIAHLHSGACVSFSKDDGAYIIISISDKLKGENTPCKPPSYIDLLLDKFSDIYIGLSNIDEITFS